MRLLCMVALALALTGCAGWNVGMGYNLAERSFSLQLERPLERGLKK